MPVEPSSSQLETAGVLFMDVMGYSKLPVSKQSDVLGTLNQIVRATDSFREVEAAGKLTRLPTGDGMALVFFSPDPRRRWSARWKSAGRCAPIRRSDCGDAGHIFLTQRVAEDLAQSGRWQPHLRDLGSVAVRHGVNVHVFNLVVDNAGNPNPPTESGRTGQLLQHSSLSSAISGGAGATPAGFCPRTRPD